MFCSSHVLFLVFGHFGDEVTKIQKYHIIFVYILQGKTGKGENWKENNTTKATKIPKTKTRKYGMIETNDKKPLADIWC